jgi:hypothetical protein
MSQSCVLYIVLRAERLGIRLQYVEYHIIEAVLSMLSK